MKNVKGTADTSKRAKCPVCGRMVGTKNNGALLTWHLGHPDGGYCDGSEHPPEMPKMQMEKTMRLKPRELAAILAGLRYIQRVGISPNDDEYYIVTDGETLIPLTLSEIDALCERINR